MNILIYEDFTHFTPLGHLFGTGFSALGHDVYRLPYANFNLDNLVDLKIDFALIDNGALNKNSNDLLEFKESNPDVKIVCIAYMPDSKWSKFKGVIDFFLGTFYKFDKGKEMFNELGFEYHLVPLGAEHTVFFPLDINLQTDISFAGTLSHGYREEDIYLQPLLDDTKYSKAIFGVATDSTPAQFIQYSQLNYLYNASAVNINFHYPFQSGKINDPNSDAPRLDLNGRVFEIALAGSFQMVDNHPMIKEIFGDSIPTSDGSDWKDMADHYLANPKERKLKAMQARKIVLAGHTWKHRATDILEKLEK